MTFFVGHAKMLIRERRASTANFPLTQLSGSREVQRHSTFPRQTMCLVLFAFFGSHRRQVDVEVLLPRMQGICEFMLAAQLDPDPEVGLLVGSGAL